MKKSFSSPIARHKLAALLLTFALSACTMNGAGGAMPVAAISTSTAKANDTAIKAATTSPGMTSNLIVDSGFETGTAGFYAQESTDLVKRSMVSPISGTASLRIKINTWGNNIWWTKSLANTPYSKAVALGVAGVIRI